MPGFDSLAAAWPTLRRAESVRCPNDGCASGRPRVTPASTSCRADCLWCNHPTSRRHGLTVANLDPARRGALKDEIFTRYLNSHDQVYAAGADQLTRELRNFVDCVRTGSRPRVSGEDGLAAVTLATRVLTSLREHQWEGRSDGPKGPANMPLPIGRLFEREDRAAA